MSSLYSLWGKETNRDHKRITFRKVSWDSHCSPPHSKTTKAPALPCSAGKANTAVSGAISLSDTPVHSTCCTPDVKYILWCPFGTVFEQKPIMWCDVWLCSALPAGVVGQLGANKAQLARNSSLVKLDELSSVTNISKQMSVPVAAMTMQKFHPHNSL